MPGEEEVLKATLERSIKGHDPRVDSILFNGGTAVALGATGIAAALPWSGTYSWIPRALSALAAFVIGIERSLHFGHRWQYHLLLRRRYESLLDRVDLLPTASGSKREMALSQILADLEALRHSEGNVPFGEPPKA